MRDLGNSLIVVEHDEDTMRASDYVIDIGPGAGIHGGNVVAAGTPRRSWQMKLLNRSVSERETKDRNPRETT